MENNFTPELIEKAKSAKSETELLSLAKENGVELTEEQTKAYFEQLHKSGELSDEELDNVSGGGCYRENGNLSVSSEYSCKHWKCSKCGSTVKHFCFETRHVEVVKPLCRSCIWATSASTICTNPLNNKNNQ